MFLAKKLYFISKKKYLSLFILTAWGLFSALSFLIKYKSESFGWKSTVQGLNFLVYFSCSFTIYICKLLKIFDLQYDSYHCFWILFLCCQILVYLLGGYVVLKLIYMWDKFKKQKSTEDFEHDVGK